MAAKKIEGLSKGLERHEAKRAQDERTKNARTKKPCPKSGLLNLFYHPCPEPTPQDLSYERIIGTEVDATGVFVSPLSVGLRLHADWHSHDLYCVQHVPRISVRQTG